MDVLYLLDKCICFHKVFYVCSFFCSVLTSAHLAKQLPSGLTKNSSKSEKLTVKCEGDQLSTEACLPSAPSKNE